MNFEQEKIRLLWAGEWPLWQTAGLAFLLLLLAAWIYRKEASAEQPADYGGCYRPLGALP